MKMKTNKFMTYALSAMMLGSLAACSSDDSEPDNGGNSGGETTDTPYVWGTEGSIKTRNLYSKEPRPLPKVHTC